ncbi:hypothetical protein Sme01_16050 [Sphaerisporangium melleum]|uniref:Outer membrane channel protein CpnT-like N-terminal domain-containing protein n=1 Tax=Sphaerisporangium melleum TaxID=321316 RepID=A0A917RKG7_9ACTN|nr:hypothetical protein [Sphaerisporangium melleum]GGL10612.1 hypothetical protein GCM10007964_60990 [Sphaerisporangium melleum]GII69129.1 hypothetical protein Sme01_16050 [Sphaerisporangium melleum]
MTSTQGFDPNVNPQVPGRPPEEIGAGPATDVTPAWGEALPAWADTFIALLASGQSWPKASESLLRELAREHQRLGAGLQGSVDPGIAAGRAVLVGWQVPATPMYLAQADQVLKGESGVNGLAQAHLVKALQADDFARETEYSKISINVAFWIGVTAAFIALVSWFFTAGLSTPVIGPIAAATRTAIGRILTRLAAVAGREYGAGVAARLAAGRIAQTGGRSLARTVLASHLGREVIEEIGEEVLIDAWTQHEQMRRGTRTSWDWDRTAASAIGAAGGAVVGMKVAAPLLARYGGRIPLMNRLDDAAGGGPGFSSTLAGFGRDAMHTGLNNMIASPAGSFLANGAVYGEWNPLASLTPEAVGGAFMGGAGRTRTISPTNPEVLSAIIHPVRSLQTAGAAAAANDAARTARLAAPSVPAATTSSAPPSGPSAGTGSPGPSGATGGGSSGTGAPAQPGGAPPASTTAAPPATSTTAAPPGDTTGAAPDHSTGVPATTGSSEAAGTQAGGPTSAVPPGSVPNASGGTGHSTAGTGPNGSSTSTAPTGPPAGDPSAQGNPPAQENPNTVGAPASGTPAGQGNPAGQATSPTAGASPASGAPNAVPNGAATVNPAIPDVPDTPGAGANAQPGAPGTNASPTSGPAPAPGAPDTSQTGTPVSHGTPGGTTTPSPGTPGAGTTPPSTPPTTSASPQANIPNAPVGGTTPQPGVLSTPATGTAPQTGAPGSAVAPPAGVAPVTAPGRAPLFMPGMPTVQVTGSGTVRPQAGATSPGNASTPVGTPDTTPAGDPGTVPTGTPRTAANSTPANAPENTAQEGRPAGTAETAADPRVVGRVNALLSETLPIVDPDARPMPDGTLRVTGPDGRPRTVPADVVSRMERQLRVRVADGAQDRRLRAEAAARLGAAIARSGYSSPMEGALNALGRMADASPEMLDVVADVAREVVGHRWGRLRTAGLTDAGLRVVEEAHGRLPEESSDYNALRVGPLDDRRQEISRRAAALTAVVAQSGTGTAPGAYSPGPEGVPAAVRELAERVARMRATLDEAQDGLRRREEVNRTRADEATQRAAAASGKAERSRQEKDAWAAERRRAQLAEERLENIAAEHYTRIADAYQAALRQAEQVAAAYAEVAQALARLASATETTESTGPGPSTQPAQSTQPGRSAQMVPPAAGPAQGSAGPNPSTAASTVADLAAEVARSAERADTAYARYAAALDAARPPRAALATGIPSGRLPYQTRLTNVVNQVLADEGADHSYSVSDLSWALSGDVQNLTSADGVVLRAGTRRPAELMVRATLGEPVEVPDPGRAASELMVGLLPQGGGSLAATAARLLGWATGLDLSTVVQAVPATGTFWDGIKEVAKRLGLNVRYNRDNTTGTTGSHTQYVLPGQVADNRGDATLVHVPLTYQVHKRDADGAWVQVAQVAEGIGNDRTGLELSLSHAHTTHPPEEPYRLPAGEARGASFPRYVPMYLEGLEDLADTAVATHGPGQAPLSGEVRDQVRTILTQQLPGHLDTAVDDPEGFQHTIVDGGRRGILRVRTRVVADAMVSRPGWKQFQEWLGVVFSGFTRVASAGVGAGTAVSAGWGLTGDSPGAKGFHGLGVRLNASIRRGWSRSDGASASSVAIYPLVRRWMGRTTLHDVTLRHEVTIKFFDEGEARPVAAGDTRALLQAPEPDAGRAGWAVDPDAVVRDDAGEPRRNPDGSVRFRDDPSPEPPPGREARLPDDMGEGSGRMRGPGAATVYLNPAAVRETRHEVMRSLRAHGLLPGVGAGGLPRPSLDPLERDAQLANLQKVREQLSVNGLQSRMDQAAQGGVVLDLVRMRAGESLREFTLRVTLRPEGRADYAGMSEAEGHVALNIASNTVTRTWRRAVTWAASLGLGIGPLVRRLGLRWTGAEAGWEGNLGRSAGWGAGYTLNEVTLIEGTPVAEFRQGYRFRADLVDRRGQAEPLLSPETMARTLPGRLMVPAGRLPQAPATRTTPAAGTDPTTKGARNPETTTNAAGTAATTNETESPGTTSGTPNPETTATVGTSVTTSGQATRPPDTHPTAPSAARPEAHPAGRPGTPELVRRSVLVQLDPGGDLVEALRGVVRRAAGTDPQAFHELAAFGDMRTLISNTSWLTTDPSIDVVVRRPGGGTRRVTVTLHVDLGESAPAGVNDLTTAKIHLALGSTSASTGRSHGNTGKASGAIAHDVVGGLSGGVNGSAGRSGGRSLAWTLIAGDEPIVVETGLQQALTAGMVITLSARAEGSADVHRDVLPHGTLLYDLPQLDALTMYGHGEIALPLDVAGDVIERVLDGHVSFDPPMVMRMARRYVKERAAALRDGFVPVSPLVAAHEPEALFDRLAARLGGELNGPARTLDELLDPERLRRADRVALPGPMRERLGTTAVHSVELFSGGRRVELLDAVLDRIRAAAPDAARMDPVMTRALAGMFAGDTWWGTLENQLSPHGFQWEMPVRVGPRHTDLVRITLRSEMPGDRTRLLGRSDQKVIIRQKYRYKGIDWSAWAGWLFGGGVSGGGAAGGHGASGSLGTHRAHTRTVSGGEQLTRLYGTGSFDGGDLVGQPITISVRAERVPLSAARTGNRVTRPVRTAAHAVARTVQSTTRRLTGARHAATERAAPEPLTLTGTIVRLVEDGLTVREEQARPLPPRVPDARPVELRDGFFPVETIADGLVDAVRARLAAGDLLGPDGVQAQWTRVAHALSRTSLNAGLEFMLAPEGEVMLSVPMPGGRMVDVVVRARLSEDRLEIGERGNIEERHVHRREQRFATGEDRSRLTPISRGVDPAQQEWGTSENVSSGARAGRSTSANSGARKEKSGFDRHPTVTVGVRMDCEVVFEVSRLRRDGSRRPLRTATLPEPVTGHALVAMSAERYEAVRAAQRTAEPVAGWSFDDEPAAGMRRLPWRRRPSARHILDDLMAAVRERPGFAGDPVAEVAGEVRRRVPGLRPGGRIEIGTTAHPAELPVPLTWARLLARRLGAHVHVEVAEPDGTVRGYLATPDGELASDVPDGGFATALATLPTELSGLAVTHRLDLRGLYNRSAADGAFADLVAEALGELGVTPPQPPAPAFPRPLWGPGPEENAATMFGSLGVRAPVDPASGYVKGRAPEAGPLEDAELRAAWAQVQPSDLEVGLRGSAWPDGDPVLTVTTGALGEVGFRPVVAEVGADRMAHTDLSAGPPYEMRVDPGTPAELVARTLVHEVGHAVRELVARAGGTPQGVLRPALAASTPDGTPAPVTDACAEARVDEYRHLSRRWTEAPPERRPALRTQIEGLARLIEARGLTPPPPPWTAGDPAVPAPRPGIGALLNQPPPATPSPAAAPGPAAGSTGAASEAAVPRPARSPASGGSGDIGGNGAGPTAGNGSWTNGVNGSGRESRDEYWARMRRMSNTTGWIPPDEPAECVCPPDGPCQCGRRSPDPTPSDHTAARAARDGHETHRDPYEAGRAATGGDPGPPRPGQVPDPPTRGRTT